MCQTHQHTSRRETAVLEQEPPRREAARPVAPTLPPAPPKPQYHTARTETASLGRGAPPPTSKPPQPPSLSMPPRPNLPPTRTVTAPSSPTASTPKPPAAQPAGQSLSQLSAQVLELFDQAFVDRRAGVAAAGGTYSKGAEQRWQSETLAKVFRLCFPGEAARDDLFEGPKKGATIDKVKGRLRTLGLPPARVPSFFGGNRMS